MQALGPITDSPGPTPAGRSRAGRWALAVVLVAAVVAFFATSLHRSLTWDAARSHVAGWRAGVDDHPVAAAAVFFAAYVAITALSLPVAAALTLAAGALFGRWAGTGVVSLAATLGATLAFLASRYLFRDWVRSRVADRLGALDRGAGRDGAYYLFALRLVPAVPFFLINLGMGLTSMRLRTFVVVSWAGMLPGAFLYANAGAALATIDRPADILSPPVLVALALLGLAPLATRLVARRAGRPGPAGESPGGTQ